MDKNQLRKLVREILILIGLHSLEAENLVLGTIAQESHMGKYIEQIKGPAKGICQMEPATHNDIWENFLRYKPVLANKIKALSVHQTADEMRWNLAYAIAMCRVFYFRKPAAIPFGIDAHAEYWKKHYNTHLGAGTVEEYISNYKKYVA